MKKPFQIHKQTQGVSWKAGRQRAAMSNIEMDYDGLGARIIMVEGYSTENDRGVFKETWIHLSVDDLDLLATAAQTLATELRERAAIQSGGSA